jgi:hypothetical protein
MSTNITQIPLSGTTYTLPTNAPTGSITINTIGGGGGGGSGMYLATGSSSSYNFNTITPSVAITSKELQITPQDKGDAIIKTNHNEINLDKLYKTVMMIADKMMIIADDPYFTEKYPTLKDAYEQYQTLLNLYKQGEE